MNSVLNNIPYIVISSLISKLYVNIALIFYERFKKFRQRRSDVGS